MIGFVTRDLHRRKSIKLRKNLTELLSRASDLDFLQLSWAVNVLQSSYGTSVDRFLVYPKEAATDKLGSEKFIFKWEIETLALLLLCTPKETPGSEMEKVIDCRQFGAMAHATNLLRKLENSEYSAYNHKEDVFAELHRIGHRQFDWQRGLASKERYFRFAYVYGQGACADYFEETHGVSVETFMEVSFALFAVLIKFPWTEPPDTSSIDLDPELVKKVLSIVSLPLPEMRKIAKALVDKSAQSGQQNKTRVAYLPSALRQYPIIGNPENTKFNSPLPELIVFRATAGLYYDIRKGNQQLTTEANERFEGYTREVIESFCPGFTAHNSERYGPNKGFQVDTPDVMLDYNAEVVAVLECKATKLTFEAQYSDNPFEEAERAYSQIVKGIVQLWKFFSDVRRGVYHERVVRKGAHCIVLTMESWMLAHRDLQEKVLASAREQVREVQEVTEEDMRPIIYCSIQDLIDVMFVSTEDECLATFAAAELPKHAGWGLREVRRDLGPKETVKDFPLDVDILLPWWKKYGSTDD